MASREIASLPDPDILVLTTPLPLTRHPAEVYLAGLGVGSRRTMRSSLNALARLLTNGNCDASTIDWSALRYQHTSAVRAVLMSKYSPAQANKMLCALRRTLKEALKLGLMTSEDYSLAADIKSIKGTSLLRGRALAGEELKALMDACTSDPTIVGVRDAAMLAILMVGLRRSEVVNLDLRDFNPRTRALTIRSAKGNGTKLRKSVSGKTLLA